MMFTHTVRIQWAEPLECLELDLSGKRYAKGSTIQSREQWADEPDPVRYRVRVLDHAIGGPVHKLDLEYSESRNRHLSGKAKCWGQSRLTLNTRTNSATAYWKNIPAKASPSGYGKATLIPESLREALEYESVRRLKRKQSSFRNLLIREYQKCALSGETQTAILDAAHVKEVSDGGGWGLKNGLLLRADLHRLFDSGLLQILGDGSVRLDHEADVTERYCREVEAYKLDAKVLAEVRGALALRAAPVKKRRRPVG